MLIRPIGRTHLPYMQRVMLLAGFPPDSELPPDAAEMPHVRRFLDGWGRRSNVGILAVDDAGRALGAAWARTLDEPLLLDDRGQPVAEVAIAAEAEARGGGVGSALLDALAREAAECGLRELSLWVSPRNPAVRLYLRAGFEVAREDAESIVMRHRLG